MSLAMGGVPQMGGFRMRRTVLAIALLAHGALTWAGTGNELLSDCEGTDEFNRGWCTGRIVGYTQGLNHGLDLGGSVGLYCLPEGVTLGQLRDVTVKFLNDHPERRHEKDTLLMLDAMSEAFPCPKQSAAQ